MNKAELKKFAVEARRGLMAKVSLKAEHYGITKDNQELKIEENYGQLFINGNPYPIERKHAFHTLKQRLKIAGYDQLIEEVAYTWFNRIIAIRYMEVNNYLPDRVNVLSSSTGKNEPDILLQYETMNLDVDHQQINEWLQKGENEQAYRKLFVAQCNSLNKLLPFLFEKIDNFTELLLPDYLLDHESIVRKIVNDLSDENFFQLDEDGSRSDNVEVLGWLYQYYMSEKKEQVGGLRNNAVKKEDLPVVTQLFTPKWIVQYMVQNSLGKLYDEKYEENQLAQNWEYYLKHEKNHHLYPEFESLEDLKIIDPACGSGHILIYAFEMLYDMYEEAGYPAREIPQLILEKNLYGLDIDKRAQQIANFALLMKAAEKQPRFISRLSRKGQSPKLNVFEIVDADQSLSEEAIDYFTENETDKSLINKLLSQFENGKQFGSLINPINIPYGEWINRLYNLEDQKSDLLHEAYFNELKYKLLPILEQALLLSRKYDVVVTNPPYHNNYNDILRKFMENKYENYKSDLYIAFIFKTLKMLKPKGYTGLMTPFTWMFIVTNEKIRRFVLNESAISSLIQLEYSSFKEATVPICTYVLQSQRENTFGQFVRLTDFKGEDMQYEKTAEAVRNPNVSYRYKFNSSKFFEMPSLQLAYWSSERVRNIFMNNSKISDVADVKQGLATAKDALYLRLWHEVNLDKIGFNMESREQAKQSKKKWFPFNKGGKYRKWFGNNWYVVNWENDGEDLINFEKSVIRNPQYYFLPGITWGLVSSGKASFRYSSQGIIPGHKGSMIYFRDNRYELICFAILNSKIARTLFEMIAPNIGFEVGNIKAIPIIDIGQKTKEIEELVKDNIQISREDWDSNEISYDFDKPLFLKRKSDKNLLSTIFSEVQKYQDSNLKMLIKNEYKINEILINLYGLEDEIEADIEEEDITLTITNQKTSAKSFLSYFVGCLMGRYSLNKNGIVYAGGEFDESKYKEFKPNEDGLIHFTDDHYFDNDIIVRLREFLSVAFSSDTVDENMQWLAESLKVKKTESPEVRLRRYFLDEFFNEHCKTYQKRPIYWLVDSGKQKGLRTLIYMHRYQPDTMATIRFEHLQEIQSKYQNEIDMIDTRLANPSLSASDKRSFEKTKSAYQKKIEELQEFDKKLATYANKQIVIDLDDGVNVNYAQFENVLAKIN